MLRCAARRRLAILCFTVAVCLAPPVAILAADCTTTSVGLTPLSDLGAGLYLGREGGLYPGGSNVRPPAHESAGLAETASVVPRDAAGAPDPVSGRIVLLTIGMSNTSQESNAFASVANQDPERHPRVMIVNGAQGGQTAAVISDPNAAFWAVIDQRLADRGVTREQVQALWYKEANAQPSGGFPAHAETLRAQSERIMAIIRARYPNARLCYCSSRIYAGYATTALNPEPYAYESGFSIKWLIEEQIAGDAALNFDPDEGAVVSPWLSWGPYLWADGLSPRSDGLVWECADLSADGTHPSPQGAAKVAAMLLQFFKTDATTRPWFLRQTTDVPETSPAPGTLSTAPNPFRDATAIRLAAGRTYEHARIDIVSASGRLVRRLASGRIDPGTQTYSWDGLDEKGRRAPAGVYVVRVHATDETIAAKEIVRLR